MIIEDEYFHTATGAFNRTKNSRNGTNINKNKHGEKPEGAIFPGKRLPTSSTNNTHKHSCMYVTGSWCSRLISFSCAMRYQQNA